MMTFCPFPYLSSFLDFYQLRSLYNLSSRVHPLNTFSGASWQGFIKRDDELSFGVSGSKLRKYASLIPWLKAQKMEQVIAIGSAYSNQVLSLLQLLIEQQISPLLLLLEPHQKEFVGNGLLSHLFIDKGQIHFLKREEWAQREKIAVELAAASFKKSYLLPEGATCLEALPGAMTLADDVRQNEAQLQMQFDHIFLDAGTGFTAAAFIVAASLSKAHPLHAKVHVLALAGKENDFSERLLQVQLAAAELQRQLSLPSLPPLKKGAYQVYRPTIGKSFGSTPKSTWQMIRQMAQLEGILLDPLYSAKLFQEGAKIIEREQLKGNILFIHSGGALSLFGFQSKLQALI